MSQIFNHIAKEYDQNFTHSVVGRAQRELVYNQLDFLSFDWPNTRVLELNCGTGEDALYMGEKGATVFATDISLEMVQIASSKTKILPNVQCETLDITHIDSYRSNEKFDLIFSNFGGLNCLSPADLKAFLHTAKKKLTSNGKLILVIMPEFCIWESIYFMGKFKCKEIFRRKIKNGILANVAGEKVKTYYYSPLKIVKWAGQFKLHLIAPIGLFVPPSYLNNFFKDKPKLIQKLKKMDQNRRDSFHLSAYSDHYLICLTSR
ncbi:MAG: SAM-dependent methyltransferase [Halieaceae bacterium]